MRRIVGFILVVTVALLGAGRCVAAKQRVAGPPGVTYSGGDGSDCKNAVIIKGADGELREAEAEAAWLAAHDHGYTKVKAEAKGQNTVITIRTSGGAEKAVCFGFKPEKLHQSSPPGS